MRCRQHPVESRSFLRWLILLAALLALVLCAWLYARVLQPRPHHVAPDAAPGSAAMLAASQKQPCGMCHPDSAHLRHSGGFVRASGQGWISLDQYSIQCLRCHGGKVNTVEDMDVIVVASNQILRHGSLNHSIGRSYAEAAIFGGYRPMETLSNKIRLPNGVVSCISCHESEGNIHGKLITPTTGSALCFECHDL